MPGTRRLTAWGIGLCTVVLTVATTAGATAYAIAGGSASANGSYGFVAKLQIGDTRSCTGVLVTPRWLLTSASCFADGAQPLVAGAPTMPTTAIIGRTDLSQTGGHVETVIKLVPRTDRDVVLAELSNTVTDVAPIPLATTGATVGETLRTAGYGRSATEWVPDQMQTAQFNVTSVSDDFLSLSGSTSDVSLCKGDSGGPMFRDGDPSSLVAISTASWQYGCLDSTATQQGATATRVDDLAEWVRTTTAVPYDVNGDGFTDIVVHDSSNGALWLFPGNGLNNVNGVLGGIKIGQFGWQDMPFMKLTDLNGDDRPDIVAVDQAGALWLYPGTGQVGLDTTFGPRVQLGLFDWSTMLLITTGDFNGDGRSDIIAVDPAGALWLYPNTGGTGLNTLGPRVKLGLFGWNDMVLLAAGDVNGDGRPDLVGADKTGALWLYPNTGGTGQNTLGARVQLGLFGWNDMTNLVLADRTDDGLCDLVVTDNDGVMWFYPNTGGTGLNTLGTRGPLSQGGWGGMVIG